MQDNISNLSAGRIVAILQARTGSKRLPGKVLTPLLNKPMVTQIIQRLLPTLRLNQFVLATTHLAADDILEDIAHENGIACFRGAEEDCLDRYYQAAKAFNATTIVRLTADNPLLDANFVDWVIEQYLNTVQFCDYIDTAHSKTFPIGLSVEVFSWTALEKSWQEDIDPASREHVTTFILQHPERFHVIHLSSAVNYGAYRWTVDQSADLELVRRIYNFFGANTFHWHDILKALESHPDWVSLNQNVRQREL